MTASKPTFRIKLDPRSSCAESRFYAALPVVAAMPDLDSRNFDYAPISPAAVKALHAAGIRTYADVWHAPQAALDNDEFHPGRCIEDIHGLGPKGLAALMDNLMGFGWDYADSVKPVRAAACSAVASDSISEEVFEPGEYVEPGDDRDPADRERTFFFEKDGDETDDVEDALTSVRVLDRSPSSYTGIVEVYASNGATAFTHEYEWYPAGRDVPALDDEGFMNEARSALSHMSEWSRGEKSTVLVDHASGWVWHVAAPGTSGIDAAKEIDRQNSAEPRDYYLADLETGDNGYSVHHVPTALAEDLAGQSARDTAIAQLFDLAEQIHFTDARAEDEHLEDDYEGRCDSMAGAELDRDYD